MLDVGTFPCFVTATSARQKESWMRGEQPRVTHLSLRFVVPLHTRIREFCDRPPWKTGSPRRAWLNYPPPAVSAWLLVAASGFESRAFRDTCFRRACIDHLSNKLLTMTRCYANLSFFISSASILINSNFVELLQNPCNHCLMRLYYKITVISPRYQLV